MAYDEWKKIDVFRAVQYNNVLLHLPSGSGIIECRVFQKSHSYTTKKGTSP